MMADFSLFGSGAPEYFDWTKYSRPQTGLTLEDLWQPAPRPQYPAAPTPFGSFQDLGPDAKKMLRREAILRIAAALGGPSGQLGSNLARAAGSLSDWKEEQLEQARGRQKEDYALSSRQAEFEADQRAQDRKDAQEKLRAQGMLAAVQQIAEEEPAWGARAEALAKAGRYEDISKMLEKLPERKALRARGIDPDDPLADEEFKEKLKLEYSIKEEEEAKKKGLDRYYDKPVDLEEIEARSAAAARGQRSIWGDRGSEGSATGRLFERPEGVFRVTPDAEGRMRGELVPGIPPEERWSLIKGDEESGGGDYWASPTGAVRSVPPGPGDYIEQKREDLGRAITPEEQNVLKKQWVNKATPMVLSEVVNYAENQLGRKLTAKERNEVGERWKTGQKPGAIVSELKAPKPPAKGAPTQGPPPRRPSGPPPQQIRPAPSHKKKASDREQAVLRQRIETDPRFATLSPEEKEDAFRRALLLYQNPDLLGSQYA